MRTLLLIPLIMIIGIIDLKETIDIRLDRGDNKDNTYTVISNSTLSNDFNISTMSSCGCSYNQLFYLLPSSSSEENSNMANFTIIPSDSNVITDIKLFSNNYVHPSYYSLEERQSETNTEVKSYSLSIDTQCSTKRSTTTTTTPTMKNQSVYYHPISLASYENWSAIRFEFTYDNSNYYFEFIQFCQLDSKLLSIVSCVIIFLIATLMLFLSTYMQIDLKIIREVNEVTQVEWYYGFIFVIIISCVLLLIFFFIKYMIAVYTVLFFFQSIVCLYYALKYFTKTLLNRFNPELNKKRYYSFNISDYISIIASLSLVSIYFINRCWALNNLLAFGMVFTLLSLILFKNFKVCFWFLLCIFIYDTFWVFFSEKVFKGNNVMVKAATSIRLPIKLEMPILFSTNPIKDCMMLGLGDIALPGLIVKYCKRFDSLSVKYNSNSNHNSGGSGRQGKWNYFCFAMMLYVVSVAFAMMMMFAFEHSQPVLFYISPMFIIGLMLKAYMNGELAIFWDGMEKEEDDPAQGGSTELNQTSPSSSPISTDAHTHTRVEREREREGTEMSFSKVKLDEEE